MGEPKSVAIVCTACGAEALLVRRPQYDGFKKTGEELSCSACGHRYAGEADVPFRKPQPPALFTDADRPRKIELFAETEVRRLCRHCAQYIVNPFRQWCSRHRKDVEATDTCDDFQARPPEKTDPPPPAGPRRPVL